MTISTNYQFEQAVRRMGTLRTSMAQTQAQLATGRAVTMPSDDPVKAGAITRLQSAINRQDSYANTLATVGDRLKTAETAVNGASDTMNRVKELLLQAANDTRSPQDRANIAIELESLRADLQSQAATRDTNGHYIFGGTRIDPQPFAAQGLYVGDSTATQVAVSDQRTITANIPGGEAFAGVLRSSGDRQVAVGFFQAIDDMVAAVRGSDRAAMQRSIAEMDRLQGGLGHTLVRLGAEQATIANQKDQVEQTKLRLQTTLSGLQDLDYTEAVTRLQRESLSLEASQSGFAKVSALNLFNFIK